MQNYDKVKNVEEFAHLGGYTTTTFRRLFKDVYKRQLVGSSILLWLFGIFFGKRIITRVEGSPQRKRSRRSGPHQPAPPG